MPCSFTLCSSLYLCFFLISELYHQQKPGDHQSGQYSGRAHFLDIQGYEPVVEQMLQQINMLFRVIPGNQICLPEHFKSIDQ